MPTPTAYRSPRLAFLPATEAAMNRHLDAVRLADGTEESRVHLDQTAAEYQAARAVDPACLLDEAAECDDAAASYDRRAVDYPVGADGYRASAGRMRRAAADLRARASALIPAMARAA